jgi:hypothetical protein
VRGACIPRSGRIPGGAPAPRCAVAISAAHATTSSDCKHDFDTIIVLQLKFVVPAARHDFPVDLNRHAPFAKAHVLQQCRDRQRRLETLFLTVEHDLHDGE